MLFLSLLNAARNKILKEKCIFIYFSSLKVVTFKY